MNNTLRCLTTAGLTCSRKFHAGTLAMLAAAIMACVPTASAHGQTTGEPLSLIQTHATAHTRLPNTVADVSVSIQSDGTTVAAVSKTLSEKSQSLLTYLRSQHADRLATQQVSIDPKTHTPKGGPDEIVGYSGRTSVTFRAPVDQVSDLITSALAHGANTLDSVNFQPREEEVEAARRELATQATKNALAQAEAVAKAVNIHATSIHRITVDPGGSYISPRPMMMSSRVMAAAPQAQIATEAGDQEVSITVNLEVKIAP